MAATAALSAGQRRAELYGLDRNKQAQTLKDTLTQSHVLQQGEYNYLKNNLGRDVWTTTSSLDFKKALADEGRRPAIVQSEKPTIQQMESHFALGNDSGHLVPAQAYRVSTTRTDYAQKHVPRPEVKQADNTVYWPDMAPQYAVDRSVGGTEYTQSFLDKGVKVNQSAPMFPKIDSCKVQLPLNLADKKQLRDKVSVSLGSDPQSYDTDYGRAYSHSAPPGGRPGTSHQRALIAASGDAQKVTSRMKTLERNSSVFRKGDYNNLGQEPGSIFTLDYGRSLHTPSTSRLIVPGHAAGNRVKGEGDLDPEKEEEEESGGLKPKIPQLLGQHVQDATSTKFREAAEGKRDHTSAHFAFGSDDNRKASVYHKDYEPASRAATQKPLHVSRPPDSEVLQRDPDGLARTGRSTTLTEYGPETHSMGVSANADMMRKAQENLVRRHGNNVVISYDKARHRDDRLASLSHKSFVGPPPEFQAMEPLKAPRPAYNYLHTEAALPHPVNQDKRSEAETQFRGYAMDNAMSVDRRKTKDDLTKSRLDHGRSTHFTFGYDPSNFYSEHQLKFLGRPKEDENVPPAGKIEAIPKFDFTHINMSENQQDFKPEPYKVGIMEALSARKQAVAREVPTLPSHNASVMKNDFQPLNERKMTPAQLVMLRQNERLEAKPFSHSHLFHTDAPGKNNFESTTMDDFIKPELMTGAKYLAAR